MGDLNLTKDDAQIDSLRKSPGMIDPIGDTHGDSFDRILLAECAAWTRDLSIREHRIILWPGRNWSLFQRENY